MKNRTATTALVIVAMVMGLFGAVGAASANTWRAAACTKCHKKTTKVSIVVTPSSTDTDTATYTLALKGGKGKAGWTVFADGKIVARGRATTGTVTLQRGATYKVWGVRKSTGARSKALVVQ
jgi:hypothetical protein